MPGCTAVPITDYLHNHGMLGIAWPSEIKTNTGTDKKIPSSLEYIRTEKKYIRALKKFSRLNKFFWQTR